MKKDVLQVIYKEFDRWSQQFAFVCSKGCASCCTRNVTATSLEAAVVLDGMMASDKTEWFGHQLAGVNEIVSPVYSINTFAKTCMEGEDVDPAVCGNEAPCPFLQDGACGIYEVRPFGCRCFSSAERCSEVSTAQMEPLYLSASCVIQQLVEHLEQGWYWGNFLEVLLALGNVREYSFLQQHVSADVIARAENNVKKAIPLPGFLYGEEEASEIEELLNSIFETRLGRRSVEDILNGK